MFRTLLALQNPSELFRTLLTLMRVLKTEFTYLLLIEPCIGSRQFKLNKYLQLRRKEGEISRSEGQRIRDQAADILLNNFDKLLPFNRLLERVTTTC